MAGDGIPDEKIGPVTATEKDATVAAVNQPPHATGAVHAEITYRGSDADTGYALDGDEVGEVRRVVEEAENRRCSMECAQVAEKSRVMNEAVPALADEGGVGEGG